MAIKIRNDININGIIIKNTRNGRIYELKISQYADNTTLMLRDIYYYYYYYYKYEL